MLGVRPPRCEGDNCDRHVPVDALMRHQGVILVAYGASEVHCERVWRRVQLECLDVAALECYPARDDRAAGIRELKQK